jgi:Cu(I)/Ag(I) efflux system membrane fusion protein
MDLVPVYADEIDAQPGTVRIEPAILANFGVRIAEAERSSLPRVVETVGYVTYDEDSLQHIHTRVEGWIESVSVGSTGDAVREGELLFELYSPALVNAQEEFLVSLGSGSEGLRDASIERLAALGMSRPEIDRLIRTRTASLRIRFLAPSDGVITNLGVREGMFVTPAAEIVSIASLNDMWVVAEVVERQAGWLRPGQAATVTLEAVPGEPYTGEIDYIYPELDPVTRTLRVRLRFANAAARLRPNMYVRVRIEGRETGPVVHVPREAVVRGGDLNRVVVALGDGRFRSTPVELGIESGDRVAIRSGLSAGDPVVVSVQFLIDSESNIGAAHERLDGDGETPAHDAPHPRRDEDTPR